MAGWYPLSRCRDGYLRKDYIRKNIGINVTIVDPIDDVIVAGLTQP